MPFERNREGQAGGLPGNRSYVEWVRLWYRWAVNPPGVNNAAMFPLKDSTGANAHRGQDQPNQNEQTDHVFFAAGTWEGDPSGAVRTVHLDHNLSILAPVINAAISQH